MQKAPMPLPTLPVATGSEPLVPLPTFPTAATVLEPPGFSQTKLSQIKDAICLVLLDDELTQKAEVVACRLITFECGIAAHGQIVLNELYNDAKEGTLSLRSGRRKVLDSGFTKVKDPNNSGFELVGMFLSDAKKKGDSGHRA
jgi:hypothetical protein